MKKKCKKIAKRVHKSLLRFLEKKIPYVFERYLSPTFAKFFTGFPFQKTQKNAKNEKNALFCTPSAKMTIFHFFAVGWRKNFYPTIRGFLGDKNSQKGIIFL